jgi:hypothetical protein
LTLVLISPLTWLLILIFAFDFGHKRKRGGAVRGMSPRPSEGASRVIPRRHEPAALWVLILTLILTLSFGF